MKLIVAGSRSLDWLNPNDIAHYVEAHGIQGITEIVSGTARGIDRTGEDFAKKFGIKIARFPADWNRHGKKAGHLRNYQMAEYADALLVIWDGKSAGSRNMRDTMIAMNKDVYEVIITMPLGYLSES